ncbi:hypothetical protein PENSPDRAFT_68349 [Peniophora sp. CONT]|nr:hypothetical protein PENSPDRAFT_68349 [Peniophora sp. CONT]
MTFAAFVTHWALSLRQIKTLTYGRALGILLEFSELYHDANWPLSDTSSAIRGFGALWEFFLPLVAETALLGFCSLLFLIAAHAMFRQYHLRWRSRFASVIPSIACLMYTTSLLHWAISLAYCPHLTTDLAENSMGALLSNRFQETLLVLFSMNAVMSDFIVLWRMCLVWEKNRLAIIFTAFMAVTLLGINILNVISLYGYSLRPSPAGADDTEIISTYGKTSFGLAAAFLSLASNACATALVALKVWLYGRRSTVFASSAGRHTLAARVKELFVDSGVVYTTIWALYCASLFQPITTLAGNPGNSGLLPITAVAYLDAAMPQITTIYPLSIFILVALDEIRRSRGLQVLRHGALSNIEDAATTEVDAECRAMLDETLHGTPRPVAEVRYIDDRGSVTGEGKLSDGMEDA